MRSTFLTFFLCAAASQAMAQSTTVTASLNGDIARFSHAQAEPARPDVSRIDGEALGFTVGIGRAIGERWGLAFELGRTGEIENRQVVEFDPRNSISPVLVPPGIPIPEFSFESESEIQLTTFSALVWVRQNAGDRMELSYLGGLALVRSDSERDFTITDSRLAIWAVPSGVRMVEYRAAPVVGIDAAYAFTDHTAITGGLRVFAVNVSGTPGWLLRPGVGVRWRF